MPAVAQLETWARVVAAALAVGCGRLVVAVPGSRCALVVVVDTQRSDVVAARPAEAALAMATMGVTTSSMSSSSSFQASWTSMHLGGGALGAAAGAPAAGGWLAVA